MKSKRVVVTGMGVVSCFGNDVDVLYQNLLAGKSGVKPITSFPCEDYPTRFAASIEEFDVGEYMDKKQARRVDKAIAYAMVAGKKALEYAHLKNDALESLDKKRCGILIGSGIGGMATFVDGALTLKEKGARRISPFLIPYILTNMPGAMLAIDCGFMGPNYSISTACATGNFTIISAVEHIRRGEADLMLAGGTEAPINPLGLSGFCACKALSQRNDAPEKASRPWDMNRDGFVMGEGAGVLVLESLEHAQKRGATILAEFLGGSVSCDASHLTDPREDGEGVRLCVEAALRNAGISSEAINYINAHATSTQAGDLVEVRALQTIFKNPETIKMNATKSMIGHLLGAAAGVEAVVIVKSILEGKIHPTINLDNKEPFMKFDTPTMAESFRINNALSTSFGFGGHNAAIILAPFRN